MGSNHQDDLFIVKLTWAEIIAILGSIGRSMHGAQTKAPNLEQLVSAKRKLDSAVMFSRSHTP